MRMPRLTLARTMALVAASALAFLAARTWLPSWQRSARPSIGDFTLYENAPPSDDLAIRVGPNLFEVASVVRNDRDGSLRFEDGRGHPLPSRPTQETDGLVRSAPWLDAVNITLAGDPSRLGVIDLRVFDHATRTFLGKANAGFSEISPGVFQVRRIGGPLPDEVDLWFRASSHPAGERIHHLPAKVGAATPYERGTLTVSDIKEGQPGYFLRSSPGSKRPVIAWHDSKGVEEGRCSVVIDRDGGPVDGPRQIVAVSRDGHKTISDFPQHFFDLRNDRQIFLFNLGPDEIDHFEIWPFGGRHTFYFESVRLPAAGPKPFAPAPVVTFPIDGRPAPRERLAAFDPLRVRVAVREGGEGSITGVSSLGFTRAVGGGGHPEWAFSVTLEVDGLGAPGWSVSFLDRAGGPLLETGGRSGSMNGYTGTSFRGAWGRNIPVSRVGAIQIVPPR